MKLNVNDKGPIPNVKLLESFGKRAPVKIQTPARKNSRDWLVPVALILLVAIPLIAGAVRISQLVGGAEITIENARFFASPVPVVVHIVDASVFAILGAFQFVNSLRRRKPGWHRAAGRVVVGCGLFVGFSGLWMTLFYPRAANSGDLLYGLRLLFGSGMVASIILGFVAIRRGDVKVHRAWMMRGYAIGLGAGTQVLTQLVGSLILGTPNEFSVALMMGAGWVINLVVAEWSIRGMTTQLKRVMLVRA